MARICMRVDKRPSVPLFDSSTPIMCKLTVLASSRARGAVVIMDQIAHIYISKELKAVIVDCVHGLMSDAQATTLDVICSILTIFLADLSSACF